MKPNLRITISTLAIVLLMCGQGFSWSKRIYVGNLPFTATDDEVRTMFEEYGSVGSVYLVTDRDTGKPRGVGFVLMEVEEDAEKAIKALNGKIHTGKKLEVVPAGPVNINTASAEELQTLPNMSRKKGDYK